jgi:vacuolar-type H+-ATPase subunit E/Vma4
MTTPAADRRSNLVLRALIDEMLDRVRELNREAKHWAEGERERAEAELETVMARVRRIASQGGTLDQGRRADG